MKLKMLVASVAGVVALGATVGPAFADCVNVNRSDTANANIAANAPTLKSCFYEAIMPCAPLLTLDNALLLIFQEVGDNPLALGLCPQGAQYLVDQIHAAAALPGSGIDLTWVSSGLVVWAGGLLGVSNPSAQQNLSNGTGIDLLGHNAEILAVVNANLATAQGMCGP